MQLILKKKPYLLIFSIILNIYLIAYANSKQIELKDNKNFSPWIGSLKTSRAYLRTGPGKQYPIIWIYKHKGWPIVVVSKLEHWRKINTIYNIEGWFHKSQLSKKKTSMVLISDYLRKKPRKNSRKLAFLENKLIVDVIKCKIFWCKIETGERRYSGWYIKKHLWSANFIKIEK